MFHERWNSLVYHGGQSQLVFHGGWSPLVFHGGGTHLCFMGDGAQSMHLEFTQSKTLSTVEAWLLSVGFRNDISE